MVETPRCTKACGEQDHSADPCLWHIDVISLICNVIDPFRRTE